MASMRVDMESRNEPRTAEVTVTAPGLRTPRIDMQRCSASMTTITPAARARSTMRRRSGWSAAPGPGAGWRRPSTSRASFDSPVIWPVVVGDVGDVGLADERHAGGARTRVDHGDVADHDHLVVVGLEQPAGARSGPRAGPRRSRRTCGRPGPGCRAGRRGRGPRRWPRGSRAPPLDAGQVDRTRSDARSALARALSRDGEPLAGAPGARRSAPPATGRRWTADGSGRGRLGGMTARRGSGAWPPSPAKISASSVLAEGLLLHQRLDQASSSRGSWSRISRASSWAVVDQPADLFVDLGGDLVGVVAARGRSRGRGTPRLLGAELQRAEPVAHAVLA